VVNTDESTESVLGSFNDLLNSNSDLSLDYSTGKVNSKRGDNLLGVTIQDLSNIRMQ